jgi:hypothetical protein
MHELRQGQLRGDLSHQRNWKNPSPCSIFRFEAEKNWYVFQFSSGSCPAFVSHKCGTTGFVGKADLLVSTGKELQVKAMLRTGRRTTTVTNDDDCFIGSSKLGGAGIS